MKHLAHAVMGWTPCRIQCHHGPTAAFCRVHPRVELARRTFATTPDAPEATTSASSTNSTLKLYRDCLRLIQHIAPNSSGSNPRHVALRHTVTSQFKARAHETDIDVVERHKADAVRALSNYLLLASVNKTNTKTSSHNRTNATSPNTRDDKMNAAMQDYHNRSVAEARHEQTANPPSKP